MNGASASPLPWLWIIEYLSGFKQIDTSILNDLIARTPDFGGPLGRSARERISLRCLSDTEERHDFGGSDSVSKSGFDNSMSCADVVPMVLNQMGQMQLRKHDLRNFINHKKRSLPKCSLTQLKDGVLDGSNPLASELRIKELLDLIDRNPNDNRDSSPPRETMHQRRDITSPTTTEQAELILHFSRGENGRRQNSTFERDEDENSRTPQEESRRDEFGVDNGVDHVSPSWNSDSQIPVSAVGHSETINGDINAASQSMEDGGGGSPSKDGSHRSADPARDGVTSPIITSLARTKNRTCQDKEDEDRHARSRTQTLKDIRMDVAHDSVEQVEQDFCIKCNRGGRLLLCCNSLCARKVHEKCLRSSPSSIESSPSSSSSLEFVGRERFYCPSCVYYRAESEYIRAKRKLSAARKDRAAFVGTCIGSPKKKHDRPEQTHTDRRESMHVPNREEDVALRPSTVEAKHRKRPKMAEEDQRPPRRITRSSTSIGRTQNRKFDNKSANPVFPRLRRTKVIWSAEEERVLKEGVSKFGGEECSRGVPWKKILEFGGFVFLKGRTAIDLKDKWRNMCRRSSKRA